MHRGMSGPDFIVDIDGLRAPTAQSEPEVARVASRPWLAVHWRCCNAYSRIYRDRSGAHYQGACPHCRRWVTARIGPDGTPARFFEAS